MRFTTFTNKGGSEHNNDAVEKIIQNGVCAFAVVDGGAFCGDIAAKIILDSIISELKKDLRVDSAVIQGCFRAAAQKIKEITIEETGFKNVSSSAAVIILDGKKAVWGHIGSCRIYHISRGKIKEITADHTKAYKKFTNGEIKYEDITKLESELLVSISSDCVVDADISKITKLSGAYSFILCTDGLWKNVSNKTIEDNFKNTHGSKEISVKLLKEAEKNAKSDCDSMSIIVLTA